MNKKQAAEYLGCGLDNLQKLMKENKIAFTYIKGKYGQEADFAQEELDRFKEGQSKTTYVPAMEKVSIAPSVALETIPASEALINQSNKVISVFERIEKKLEGQFLLGQKLTLSLAEAAQLAGLSKGYVKKAIDLGELKAAKRGKGWNIKRSDLEMWVEGL